MSGPTTAVSIVVFATLSGTHEPGSASYIQAALTITLLAGIFQLALGMVRLGQLVSLVSHSVMVGFTAGAGVPDRDEPGLRRSRRQPAASQ